MDDLFESITEPPLPPGLRVLSPVPHTFVEFFGIDEMALRVAAQASGDLSALPEDWLHDALSQLPTDERDAYLQRLACGELHLTLDLNRRLREILPLPEESPPQRRTVGWLLREAEVWRERERRRRAEEAEARRVRDLEDLASREAGVWAKVESLIQQMQPRRYDDAVLLMVRLREQAEYQGKEAVFRQRIDQICERYSRRLGLRRRMRDAGLHSALRRDTSGRFRAGQ